MNREDFTVTLTDGAEMRADQFVASLGLFTRSQIRRRSVRVLDADGREMKLSRRVSDGEDLVVEWDDPPSSEVRPEPVELDVLYEDEDCIVVNKPTGMVVHPDHGHLHGTLVQGLLYRCSFLDDAFGGDRVRPGIVHRLDKDTSGVIIAAKNPEALEYLAAQFRDRTVGKVYWAITRGAPPASTGEVDRAIGRDPKNRKKFTVDAPNSKNAVTRYRIMDRNERYCLLGLRILTGRTHQIRVHLTSLGCPILGDPLYARRDAEYPGVPLMLHSRVLEIEIPKTGRRIFTAPIPEHFETMIRKLEFNPGPYPEDGTRTVRGSRGARRSESSADRGPEEESDPD